MVKTLRRQISLSISWQIASVKNKLIVFHVDQLAHLSVCLVCYETMTLTLFSGKTGLEVRWLIWKYPFLPFLTQARPKLCPLKAQIWNS